MPRIGETKLITFRVICPKCLKDTERWIRVMMVYKEVYITNDISKRPRKSLELCAKDKQTQDTLKKFEADILANHICEYTKTVE
jgi:hypothetical protein